MPEGVEHKLYPGCSLPCTLVRTAWMPEGVEHFDLEYDRGRGFA